MFFSLQKLAPNLEKLDLSYNYIENIEHLAVSYVHVLYVHVYVCITHSVCIHVHV